MSITTKTTTNPRIDDMRPVPKSASTVVTLDGLADVATTSEAQGDMLYRGASGWANKAAGNDGDVWTCGGAGADPGWEAIASGGDWINGTTWTYASGTTFTVSGDVASQFPVGCKLSWVQGGTEYQGYAVSAVYSSPNTTVTVAGEAVLNSAISSPKYSYASSPTGFKHWFPFTETWTGFSASPSDGFCRFKIEGRQVTQEISRGTNGTSNANNCQVSLAVTAKTLAGYAKIEQNGIACKTAWVDTPAYYYIASGASVAVLAWKPTSTLTDWNTSGDKNWAGTMTWEI